MKLSVNYYKTAGVCAFIVGILGVIWWLLTFGYTAPANLEEMIAMMDDFAYTTTDWCILLMLMIGLPVSWGVVGKKLESAPGLVTVGFFFFLTFGIIDQVYRALRIFTFNYGWAAAYTAEGATAEAKEELMEQMTGFYSMLPALYFVIIVSAVVGAFLYFLATWKGTGIEKGASIFYLLVAVGMFLLGVGIFGQQAWLLSILHYLYPIPWFVVMFMVGTWFWKTEQTF